MTQFTTPHSLPIIETTDLIAGAVDNLRVDINELATASNVAITSEGIRAEAAATAAATTKADQAKADAIADATTKYGGLPGRVTALENVKVVIDVTVGTRATAGGVLLFGDTGWRDVKASLPAGVTATNLWIRRLGSQVLVSVQGLSSNTGGTITFYTAPVGFRPDAPSIRAGILATQNTNAVRVVSPFGSTLRLLSMPSNTQFEGTFSFTTANAWPATLPGNAA